MIDWDLCCRMESHSPRLYERTVRGLILLPRLTHASFYSGFQGTWQFMSISLLWRDRAQQNQLVQHNVSHDLESFLWLLLYLVLRYRPRPDRSNTRVQRLMQNLFDKCDFQSSGPYTGGGSKSLFLVDCDAILSGHTRPSALQTLPRPVSNTLETLRTLFRDSYYNFYVRSPSTDPENHKMKLKRHAQTLLATHARPYHVHLLRSNQPLGLDRAWERLLDPADDQIAVLVKQVMTDRAESKSPGSGPHRSKASGTNNGGDGRKGKRARDEKEQAPTLKKKRRRFAPSRRVRS